MDRVDVRRLESGQALVHFALMAMGLMAMLALGIDVGLLAVQRRFDQNAADAAALAAARSLSNAIEVDANGQVAFASSGLTAAQTLVGSLVASNAHAGLTSRTVRLSELEISADGGGTWCTVGAAGGCSTPPAPVSPNPYLVRVRVASKTTSFLTGVLDPTPAAGCPDPNPGSGGVTSCALTVVSVSGTPSLPPGMQVVPVTLPRCSITEGGSTEWQVHELWGSNSSPCFDTGGWKNILDFTPYVTDQNDPDFDAFHGSPHYVPDSEYTGSGRRKDAVYWIANGFGGTVTAGDLPNGNWVQAGHSGTAEGCISNGFYGGGGACDVNGRNDDYTESYVFDNTKLVPSNYGWFNCYESGNDPVVTSPTMRVGCRDVAVAAWDEPQMRQGQSWVPISSGHPDRVHIRQFYVFRFYCGWSSDNTHCNQRPPSSVLPGCPSMGSGVCARLRPSVTVGSCPMCIGAPSVTANALRLQD